MITLEVKKSDDEIIQDILELDNVQKISPSYFDGDAIVQIIVEITKVTVPAVAGIILTYINSDKLKIKRNGVNITMLLRKKNLNKLELIKDFLYSLDNEEDAYEDDNDDR